MKDKLFKIIFCWRKHSCSCHCNNITYIRGPKKVSIPYFKHLKKYAVLSDKRTMWALCVLVPYFNVPARTFVLYLRLFFKCQNRVRFHRIDFAWLSIHCRLSYVYIIFRERDIKTKTQLEDFMITITILFFHNNKNKYLILVQIQVTVMNHNERRTVRRRVERSVD